MREFLACVKMDPDHAVKTKYEQCVRDKEEILYVFSLTTQI